MRRPNCPTARTAPLGVAALKNGKNFFQPTNANVAKGLLNPVSGYVENSAPPMNAPEGANPAVWIPVMGKVKTGYPIVGYTEFVVAQCYQSAAVGKGVVSFLKDHYSKAAYQAVQNANGFVTDEAGHGQRIPHGHRGQYPCQRQFVEYEYPRPNGLRGLDGALKGLRISAGA